MTVHDPICTKSGNIEAALYGSFLPIPPQYLFPVIDVSEYAAEKMLGAIIVKKDSPIIINEGRVRTRLRVTNGCRPVQVSNLNALIIDWSGIYKVMIYILSQHLCLSLMLHNRQTLVSKIA